MPLTSATWNATWPCLCGTMHLVWKRCPAHSPRLNTSMTVPFGSANDTISAIVGSASRLRSVLMPWPWTWRSNSPRSSSGAIWKPMRTQRAAPQHHRVVLERARQIRRVLVLLDQGEAEHLAVIRDQPREVGRLVDGMGDLANVDHRMSSRYQPVFPSRGSASITSSRIETSRSPL